MSGKYGWIRHLMSLGTACLLLVGLASMPSCTAPNDGSCNANTDCANEAVNKVCDRNNSKCVQCLKSEDCGAGEICDTSQFTCSKNCNTDDDCKSQPDFQNRPKVRCLSSTCVAACDSNEDCRADEKCDGDRCVIGPRENLPGKFESCQSEGKCQPGLQCLTYKGGVSNFCWKTCDRGCDMDETCVKAENFAEGYDVCMKKITESGAAYSFDQGTICADNMVRLLGSQIGSFGTCWDSCTDKCSDNRVCVRHPTVQDSEMQPVKVCMYECQNKDECIARNSDHGCTENPKTMTLVCY